MKKLMSWIGLAAVGVGTAASAVSVVSPKHAAPFILAGGALAAAGESIIKVKQAVDEAKKAKQ
jgi:hypothetical protein